MGEYILSSLTSASRSEEQNYGMIINYSTEGELVRWNTGSIQNQSLVDLNIQQDAHHHKSTIEEEEEENESNQSQPEQSSSSEEEEGNNTNKKEEEKSNNNRIIFKAVRYNILGELDGKIDNCKQQIQDMVNTIAIATGHTVEDKHFVVQKPIIR